MKIEYEDFDFFDYYYNNSLKIFYIEDIEEAEDFYRKNAYEVANLCFDAVKVGMKYDLIEVAAFRFCICGRMAMVNIERDKFDDTLKKCIKTFEEYEEYEKCQEAMEIINDDPLIKSETSNS